MNPAPIARSAVDGASSTANEKPKGVSKLSIAIAMTPTVVIRRTLRRRGWLRATETQIAGRKHIPTRADGIAQRRESSLGSITIPIAEAKNIAAPSRPPAAPLKEMLGDAGRSGAGAGSSATGTPAACASWRSS